MKENYDKNKEFNIKRIFPSKIYICSLLSLVCITFTFLLRSLLHRKNMVSTNSVKELNYRKDFMKGKITEIACTFAAK